MLTLHAEVQALRLSWRVCPRPRPVLADRSTCLSHLHPLVSPVLLASTWGQTLVTPVPHHPTAGLGSRRGARHGRET